MSCEKSIVPSKWDSLPSVVLTKVYELLPHKDRLNASSVCNHWRSVIFQKKYFVDSKFKLQIEDDLQCIFFLNTMWNLTSEVTLIYELLNGFHMNKVRRILRRLARSSSLTGIRFKSSGEGILCPDLTPDDITRSVSFQSFVIKPLRAFLKRKNVPCHVLDLGTIEVLLLYSMELLKSMTLPEKLKELRLASLKYDPLVYKPLKIEISLLTKCSTLEVLSLDYAFIDEEMLKALEILPLKKLLICVHNSDTTASLISEDNWLAFAERFKDIDLILSFLYSYEVVAAMLPTILCRTMPVTHFRVLFCEYMNVEALEYIAMNYSKTLKSLQWIDATLKNQPPMSTYIGVGVDPLVMMAWRCTKLQEIVIHGYAMDPHNLVGMVRLRGHSLKRFEISLIDKRFYTETSINDLIEEINCQLGWDWQPPNFNNLHPALGIFPVPDDVRNDFIHDVIHRDLTITT